MLTVIRGATVHFAVVFRDENEKPATVDGATLYVSVGGITETIEMVLHDKTWRADWDSSAAVGNVFWHVRSSGDEPTSADEGEFVVVANAANPTTAGPTNALGDGTAARSARVGTGLHYRRTSRR
jgi:hypothetical protein